MAFSSRSCFLLLLLAQLMTVSGQAPSILPSNGVRLYLAYEERIIPDYFMVYGGQIYIFDQNNDANDITDALWCQSAHSGTNIGVWYYPNGTEVPLFGGNFIDLSAPNPVFTKRFSGQIALARKDALFGYEGLYKCIIPDENGVNQTLVVGIDTNNGYNNNDGPDADPTMQFSLLSTSRLATPPVFSLSFNVSDGPPTTVSCSVNGNGISTELSRVIVNGSGSVTRVTITNLTEAGNYQCTVSNDRVTNGPISGNSHPNAVTSTSSLSISGATGYEVYYQQLFSNTPVSVGTTASTTINITSGLFQGATYTFYVVSYGSASLPSVPHPTVTILVTNGENIGLIVSVTVVYILFILLAMAMIIIVLVIFMYIKRKTNQKRKSENDIVMECSPAYATTEFKTKSTVEPVYDTTESVVEPPTFLPPPSTEYEIPTVQ
uniref:Ig-like domain-containing protein n=1 Tax=Amphimedon queenslandica TaxID=400682 RepID=A0A1X7THK3_AMPQE